MVYTPSANKTESGKTNFSGSVVDGNRVAMVGVASNFQTQDATGTPITSPTTVNTTTTLVVPANAISITITPVTNPVQVSEDSTYSTYYAVPAGSSQTFNVARQNNVYLKTSGSTVVSFYFATV